MKKCLRRRFVALLTAALLSSVAMSAERIKNVRVKENSQKQYFVMFQSVVEPALWYCGQIKPQVLIRQADRLEIPEISLIKFQKKDIKNPEKLVEGAHFRMHLSLGPGKKAYETLRKKLRHKAADKPFKLSPVPFPAIKLCLQKPNGEEVVMTAESLAGISSRHSSQNVAFSVMLDKLETDLMNSLLHGNTGAKYLLYYNYEYADPVLTGEAQSEQSRQRDFSPNQGNGKSTGRDLPGSRDFDKINRDARAATGWEKAGQGFIGFANYSKAVQEKCVFIEDNEEDWQNAYLSLPLIQTSDYMTINKIELEIKLVNARKQFATKKLTWTPAKGWRDSYGAPLVYAVFELDKIRRQVKDLAELKFNVEQKITSTQKDVLKQQVSYSMLVGNLPVSNPLNLADVFELQTGFLSWSPVASKGLQRIEVKLSEGDWQAERVIKPEFDNSEPLGPDVHQWLVKLDENNDDAPLSAEIFLVVGSSAGEKKIAWKHNGKNLRKELFSMSYIFFDQDWEMK